MPTPGTYFNDLTSLPIREAGQTLDINWGHGRESDLWILAALKMGSQGAHLGGDWTWAKVSQGWAGQSPRIPAAFASRARTKWSAAPAPSEGLEGLADG